MPNQIFEEKSNKENKLLHTFRQRYIQRTYVSSHIDFYANGHNCTLIMFPMPFQSAFKF